ncbi:hypothetical protein ABEB36_007988 [Hypothenemus hampei]|uniref:CCHC-type domain-containing protein n=1 Tax=Hypothenemus hampei TaxID=57062 RepID=A0ABD1EKA8_HYPHA
MVCKEEILTWFKDLDSYKRIDVLCELINMCLPFELRFLGSYVEETGKHSYQELRQQALAANDLDKLDKDPGLRNQTLREENVRHRMLINVSLLKSRNYNVANWYSKKILRTELVEELIAKENDDVVQDELLLLYTMAARHPAFSFENKQFYNRIVTQLYETRENQLHKSGTYRYPPGFEYTNLYKNFKVHDNNPFPMGLHHMHPPGLQQQLELIGHIRAGWPGLPCGAPSEVPPFPHQPPQPSTSPLVNSPSQSRCESPHPGSRPPTAFAVITSSTPGSMNTVNNSGIMAASPLLPPPPVAVAPVPSVLPGMVPVPMEALAPPLPLGQAGQPSAIYGPKSNSQLDNDELNTTLKEDSSQKHTWIGQPNAESKHINGLRVTSQFLPQSNVRTSMADQIQTMTLTDESSHYHSSSSSSPLQTPPETPSNLAPTTTAHRGGVVTDKNQQVNGIPGFVPPFGDTTTPSPQTAFTFPYNPMPPHSYPHPQQPPPTPAAVPPRNQPPGCYNCGAAGHLGPDCPQQNIDDITQKNTYR